MLSLIATPIGNLSDITYRAVEVLAAADAVYCEDTRRSVQLLNHLGIKKPLVSCHEHNERERAEEVVARLREGQQIAYLSDAGMPGVSDPGAVLVAACIEAGLPCTVIPGASAVLMAAVMHVVNLIGHRLDMPSMNYFYTMDPGGSGLLERMWTWIPCRFFYIVVPAVPVFFAWAMLLTWLQHLLT